MANISSIKIRMYCLGTGDCLVLKYYAGKTEKFTMMIDCGSCQGTPEDFEPYLNDLAAYVKKGVDLLIITHEHNDHVNGFSKHPDIFKGLKIKRAWMAWTEHPDDPGGRADDLIHKRKKLRNALKMAMNTFKANEANMNLDLDGDFNQPMALKAREEFMNGLDTLAEINLPAAGSAKEPLAGMKAIKEILEEKKVKISYKRPGETETFEALPGLKFYILGPPYATEAIYKHEKEGTDVYKRKLSFMTSGLAASAFERMDPDTDFRDKDIPFSDEYIANEINPSVTTILQSRQLAPARSATVTTNYKNPLYKWRKIDNDWLSSAGSLALRLNSHINNTSLAFAIEAEDSKKVVLLPGDAEFGSWQSWHNISKWNGKGKNGKHLVEDLLNRTVFYKVSHHLSFNGTPTTLGIDMLGESANDMAAMVTLDRRRISTKWKGTMPNKNLIQDLVRKCDGKVFIMDEFEIKNAPSSQSDFTKLTAFKTGYLDNDPDKQVLYKEYTVKV